MRCCNAANPVAREVLCVEHISYIIQTAMQQLRLLCAHMRGGIFALLHTVAHGSLAHSGCKSQRRCDTVAAHGKHIDNVRR